MAKNRMEMPGDVRRMTAEMRKAHDNPDPRPQLRRGNPKAVSAKRAQAQLQALRDSAGNGSADEMLGSRMNPLVLAAGGTSPVAAAAMTVPAVLKARKDLKEMGVKVLDDPDALFNLAMLGMFVRSSRGLDPKSVSKADKMLGGRKWSDLTRDEKLAIKRETGLEQITGGYEGWGRETATDPVLAKSLVRRHLEWRKDNYHPESAPDKYEGGLFGDLRRAFRDNESGFLDGLGDLADEVYARSVHSTKSNLHGAAGEYDPINKELRLTERATQTAGAESPEAALLSTALHELQHVSQPIRPSEFKLPYSSRPAEIEAHIVAERNKLTARERSESLMEESHPGLKNWGPDFYDEVLRDQKSLHQAAKGGNAPGESKPLKVRKETYDTPIPENLRPAYDAWYGQLPKNLQYTGDYDLQGAWLERLGQPTKYEATQNGHLDDYGKKPNHPTFSSGSKWHDPKIPERTGGEWKKAERLHPKRWATDADELGNDFSSVRRPRTGMFAADKGGEAGPGKRESTAPTDEQLQEAAAFLRLVIDKGFAKTDDEITKCERLARAIEAAVGAEPVEPKEEPLRQAPLERGEETQAAIGAGETEDDPLKKALEKFSQDFQDEIEGEMRIAVASDISGRGTEEILQEGDRRYENNEGSVGAVKAFGADAIDALGALSEFHGDQDRMKMNAEGTDYDMVASDSSKKGDLAALNEALQSAKSQDEGVDTSHIKYGPQEPKAPTMDDVGKAVAAKHAEDDPLGEFKPGAEQPAAPVQPVAPAQEQQETLAPGLSRSGARGNILEYEGRRISQREFDGIQAKFQGGEAQQPQAVAQPVQQAVAQPVQQAAAARPQNPTLTNTKGWGNGGQGGRQLTEREREWQDQRRASTEAWMARRGGNSDEEIGLRNAPLAPGDNENEETRKRRRLGATA